MWDRKLIYIYYIFHSVRCDIIATNQTITMHTLLYSNLQTSYVFRVQMADHQGVQMYKRLLGNTIISSTQNCGEIISVKCTAAHM
jgi:hypothetical protein